MAWQDFSVPAAFRSKGCTASPKTSAPLRQIRCSLIVSLRQGREFMPARQPNSRPRWRSNGRRWRRLPTWSVASRNEVSNSQVDTENTHADVQGCSNEHVNRGAGVAGLSRRNGPPWYLQAGQHDATDRGDRPGGDVHERERLYQLWQRGTDVCVHCQGQPTKGGDNREDDRSAACRFISLHGGVYRNLSVRRP